LSGNAEASSRVELLLFFFLPDFRFPPLVEELAPPLQSIL
jgi:hypothetical protein